MANVLPKEKQLAVLRCLVEGNSIRSTERITGVYRNTVMRLLVKFGNACHEWLNLQLSNLSLEHVECDEIWTFCGKKDKNLKGRERASRELGSQYLYLAQDQQTKLIACYRIGKRDHETTQRFVDDLSSRMHRSPDYLGSTRPQISMDGWGSYKPTIRSAFGGTVRHGVLVKQYSNPEVGRYAPPNLSGTDRQDMGGIDDLTTICTSHIERHNLSVRTFMKRFTRLAMGFSKKLDNLKAATALHVAYHNFCWRLRKPGKSGERTPTPAMMAGLTDELWSLEDLYDAVMEHDHHQKQVERYKRLGGDLASQ